MEFFRTHKKVIVGFIAIATILWMVGIGAIMAILSTRGM